MLSATVLLSLRASRISAALPLQVYPLPTRFWIAGLAFHVVVLPLLLLVSHQVCCQLLIYPSMVMACLPEPDYPCAS